MTPEEITSLKKTKKEAFLQKWHSGRRCAICNYFIPTEGTEPPAGTCPKVWGILDPELGCDEFEYDTDKAMRPM